MVAQVKKGTSLVRQERFLLVRNEAYYYYSVLRNLILVPFS